MEDEMTWLTRRIDTSCNQNDKPINYEFPYILYILIYKTINVILILSSFIYRNKRYYREQMFGRIGFSLY